MHAAVAHKGAIASAYPLATEAGQEILAKGGNAFDAAVAVSAALAVVEPTSSGLGGGGFYLLHRQADGLETMLDAREKAPAAATRDMYLDKAGNPIQNASVDGPLSAGIPGEPAVFEYLARKFGKLPLKDSLAPAIRLARDGFPLYARVQGAIRFKRDALSRSADTAKVFLTADGGVPELGALIKQPDLATTLEAIANQGAKGFYTGRVAKDLVDGVRAGGGIWTLADLASYKIIERKPLIGDYHGARIVSRIATVIGRRRRGGRAQYSFRLRPARNRCGDPQTLGDRGDAARIPRSGAVLGRSRFRENSPCRCSSTRITPRDSAGSIRLDRAMPQRSIAGHRVRERRYAYHALFGIGCRRQSGGGNDFDQSVFRFGLHGTRRPASC